MSCRQRLELHSRALLSWGLSEEMLKEAWSQSTSHETANQDLPPPVSQCHRRQIAEASGWLELQPWHCSRLAPPDAWRQGGSWTGDLQGRARVAAASAPKPG